MRILLAPMEGLLDAILRDVLTGVGGIDLCVTPFVRVTSTLLPLRTFLTIAPELRCGSSTRAGVPVRVQLLGSDPNALALNAARLATLRPAGIDLNFGCPAKTVNRHRGGAVLLQEPQLVGDIVAAVRRAVPEAIPVTAKMRLGYRDRSPALDCAQAIEGAGASELVVHARTKLDGYRPPAYWEWIGTIRSVVRLPVVANGEIWTVADYWRCREIAGVSDVMLGRGAVADPGLARRIKTGGEDFAWPELRALLARFWRQMQPGVAPKHQCGRVKQWLAYLRRACPEAGEAFQQIRTVTEPEELERRLFSS